MNLKRLSLSTTALASTAILTACGGNQAESLSNLEVVTKVGEPVKIEFWHGMSGSLGEVLESIIEDFNTGIGAEKGITVEGVYQGAYEDLKSKTMGAIKAGNNPAVVQGTVNNINEFIQSGYVQDLSPYIFHEEIGMSDFDDVYEVYRLENSSYDEAGTIYSLAFSKSTDLFFYNDGFFKEHGLEIPTTWEELVEVSKQATEITGQPSFSIDNLPNFLITYLHQANAGYTNREGELLFNNETMVEALTLLKENIDKGYWRIPGEDKYSSGPFMSNTVQMYIGSSAGATYLTDEIEWEAATVPQLNVEKPKNIQQGNNIAILNKNQSPEQVFGAYEFIKYLTSTEGSLKWTTQTGYLPIRESVVQTEEYQTLLTQPHSSVKLAGVSTVENGFVEAIFSTDKINSNMVRNEIGIMAEKIILTGADIQEAINQCESKLQ